MNTFKGKIGTKIGACILLIVLAATFACSAAGVAVLAYNNVYFSGSSTLHREVLDYFGQNRIEEAKWYYQSLYADDSDSFYENEAATLKEDFSKSNSNFYFYITDETGNIRLNNYEWADSQYEVNADFDVERNQNVETKSKTSRDTAELFTFFREIEKDNDIYHCEINISVDTNADGIMDYEQSSTYYPDSEASFSYALSDVANRNGFYDESGSTTVGQIEYTVGVTYGKTVTEKLHIRGCIRSEENMVHDSIYFSLKSIDFLVRHRVLITILAILSGLLSLAVLFFLLCSAGHRSDREGITPNLIDRIPFDLYLALILCLTVLGVFVIEGVSGAGQEHMQLAVLLIALVLVYFFALLLSVLMTFATRLKLGKWWRNTITFRILRFIWRIFRTIFGGIGYALRNISLWWKVGLIYTGLSFFEFLALCIGRPELLVPWFIEKLIVTPLLIIAVINLQELKKAGAELAGGNLDYKPDMRHLHFDFKQHGAHLSSIRNGMQTAVEEQTKSEKMKAELITNVSHDIKTPLTSIINYVDLLQKEDLSSSPNAAEYLEVLERQSAKLKKLTLDIVEASKASTGNVSVEADVTDLNVLLTQACGEYEEKLATANLTPVLTCAETPLPALVDGRLLWRVFDNLLNNIAKYAMPGTRVYVSSEARDGYAVISFKNVSASPLNITKDELMERFVRGDSSRNTDGSGLGLSIAESLTALQNGQFDITIDGDLFRSEVRFPLNLQ